MGTGNFKVEPKGLFRDPPSGPVGPFHQREGRRVPGKFFKADGVEIALPFQAIKIKMSERKFSFVKVKQDKGRAFDPLPVFDPKPPGQSLNEKGLPASDAPGQGDAIAGTEPPGKFFCPGERLVLGTGMKNGG